jgi:ABC-type dipeptide/oligopeptide/nickel transport system permease subunit
MGTPTLLASRRRGGDMLERMLTALALALMLVAATSHAAWSIGNFVGNASGVSPGP